jgi:hypothetical protein
MADKDTYGECRKGMKTGKNHRITYGDNPKGRIAWQQRSIQMNSSKTVCKVARIGNVKELWNGRADLWFALP